MYSKLTDTDKLDWLISLFYLLYPFQQKGILGIHYFKPYYLVFGILMVFSTIFTLRKGSINLTPVYFYLPYVPFLIWVCLSILWSVKPNESIYAFLKYLIYFFIGIIVSYYLLTTRGHMKIVVALYFSALVVSVLYLCAFMKEGISLLFSGKATMSTISQISSINVGFGGGRNLLASWCSFAFTFSFPFLLTKCKKIITKIILIISSFFLLLVILLTLSRTAMLSVFVCFIGMVIITKNRQLKKMSFCVLFLSVFVLGLVVRMNIFHLGDFLINRFVLSVETLKGREIDYGTVDRLVLWKRALHCFLTNPLNGSGIGTLYKGRNEIGGVHNYHNIFLQFLAQVGLVGLFFFLIWTLWLLYVNWLNADCFISTEYSFLSNLVIANMLTYYFKSLLMFQYFDLEIWTLVGFSGALYCVRQKINGRINETRRMCSNSPLQ